MSYEYFLIPQLDSRKSFYKKAKVIRDNGKIQLKSYNTIVAEIKDNKPIVHGTYSPTTLRHIKDFLHQYNFKVGSKKDIMKMYGLK